MSNFRFPLRSDRDIECAKDAAAHITSLMYMMNQWNSIPLCYQEPESPYGQIREALISVLKMLGVPNRSKAIMAVQDLQEGASVSRVLQVYASDPVR